MIKTKMNPAFVKAILKVSFNGRFKSQKNFE